MAMHPLTLQDKSKLFVIASAFFSSILNTHFKDLHEENS